MTIEPTQDPAPETGRARVRRLLIEPLTAGGFKRPANKTADDHRRELEGLADRLAYMQPDALDGLAEGLIRIYGGKLAWPPMNAVLHMAWALQVPPPRESTYARSIVRSAMGRRARDEGFLVELFQIAKRLGPPPGRYIAAKLRDQARDNRARLARVRERLDAGVADAEDRAFLDAYLADRDEAEAILADAEAAAALSEEPADQ